jgi:hypothetical protein
VELDVLSKYDWKKHISAETQKAMVDAMLTNTKKSLNDADSFAGSMMIGLSDESDFFQIEATLKDKYKTKGDAPKLTSSELLRLHALPLFAPSVVQAWAMGCAALHELSRSML